VLRGAPVLSLCFLALAIACAICAPLLAPYDPIQTNRAQTLLAPRLSEHLLGTDHLGRDILSRLVYGARISVTVGFLAVFVSGTVGTLIAVVSGVVRGWADTVLMRLTDAFLALPFLMVAVLVVSLLGPSLVNVVLVIGLLRWMTYARTIRGEVLRLTEMDFVRLARAAGARPRRIIVQHILPNIVNTLLVLGTLEVGAAVITEASLSFLGLGVPRPLPSWGTMLAESQTYVFTAWWLPVFPGIAITLLVMASNLTGDWLRDRLDPTRRQL
jgi:peptide/nickel transport system permease protein